MSAQESALAVSKRIGGSTHLSQICIGANVQLTDQIQIVIQYLIEILALFSGFLQNHGQMQGNCPDIESSDKHRGIILIGRMHSASLVPGRKKGTASHGRNDLAVLFIDTGHISLSCETQPVGVHGFGRALHTCLEDILQGLSRPVKIFVIEKYDLREQNRFLALLLTLSSSSHI